MILLKKNDIINYKEVKSMLPEKELELLYDYMVRILKGMKKK